METSAVVCTPSINDSNTWFIFRENGIEVKIVLIDGEFRTSRKLTYIEIEYLKTNLR